MESKLFIGNLNKVSHITYSTSIYPYPDISCEASYAPYKKNVLLYESGSVFIDVLTKKSYLTDRDFIKENMAVVELNSLKSVDSLVADIVNENEGPVKTKTI